MRVLPFEQLLDWILAERASRRSVFGIPEEAFWKPDPGAPFASEMFGQPLLSPIGPAAGPHTQLAQNIVAAWLCGGRFIELKTVQIMDELAIPRPCIDAADEGYNVEWSQELRLPESAGEYVKAWVLVHVLHRMLGFPGPVGTVFNMSVGYNLEGVTSGPLRAFMDRLADASGEIADLLALVRRRAPALAEADVPSQVATSVTLSTMHGCPPGEIEAIARFLLTERGLPTFVKLNPTLLGKDEVLRILHDHLGFREIHIPEGVFAHDLRWEDALPMLRRLRSLAAEREVPFGVKLSNTLAMANHRRVLPGDEVYMSGRALYPITMNLFRRLAEALDGDLLVSYSAGADSENVATILSCGARPVTAATDLLKPGGYGRLRDWIDKLAATMTERGARSLEELARDRMANLARAAEEALRHPRYRKDFFPGELPKTERPLGTFDCLAAPCAERCPIGQDVPEYAWALAQGDPEGALAAVLAKNPLPGVLGYICTHVCEDRCTRIGYEAPVAIRALKRVAFDRGREPVLTPAPGTGKRVAVIGAGPSGLAAAYFLALSGVAVTVYERSGRPGGMPLAAPAFRIPPEVIERDVERIRRLGVEIRVNSPVSRPPEELLREGYNAVYVATGLPADATLGIPGEEGPGVLGAVAFLQALARGERVAAGPRVVVVGGGNVAVDAARAASRLVGSPVTVAYRRTRAEMPADREELSELLREGNELLELVQPLAVVRRDGAVAALRLVRTRLGPPGPDGRRTVEPVPGSEFDLPADTVVVAIGQRADAPFLSGSWVWRTPDGRVRTERGRAGPDPVYAGGDLVRGASTVVEACADGRAAAEAICRDLGIPFRAPPLPSPRLTEADLRAVKLARIRKEPRRDPPVLPPEGRRGWGLVEGPLSPEDARAEALRCLQCSSLCDKCVEVCPNRANLFWTAEPVTWRVPVLAVRDGTAVQVGEESFVLTQVRQIAHVADLCNECGNCATFCVHQGRPFADKPRFYLTEEGFRKAEGRAFHLAEGALLRRDGGGVVRLLGPGPWTYEDDELVAVLDREFRPVELRLKRPFSGRNSLLPAAEMAVLLEGLRSDPLLGGNRG